MCGQWSPYQFESGIAFRFLIRRELGSKSVRRRHETSCYWHRYCSRDPAGFGFNDLLIYLLLANTVKRSCCSGYLELSKYSTRRTMPGGFTPLRSVFMAAMRWGREQNPLVLPQCSRQFRDVAGCRAGHMATSQSATNWRQNPMPLIWRHVARARLLC